MIQTKISTTGEPAIIIEPKDLRIGNVLLYKGRYVHVTMLSMDIDDEYQETIGFCKLGKHTNEICDWNRALCADLKTVPLTTEILQKVGFIIVMDEDGQAALIQRGKNKIDGVWIKRKGFKIDGPYLYINHLHQLQNLYFALTGEELKIEL